MGIATKTNFVTQQQLKVLRGGPGLGHVHSNKSVLDGITQESWEEIHNSAHSHSNKMALDLLQYDEEQNLLYIGSPDNPVNFAAFGQVSAGGVSRISGGVFLPLSGGTLSGPLTLSYNGHTVKIELDETGNLKINGNIIAPGYITEGV